MNNAFFRKTIKNLRNHKDIKLVTTEATRNYLVSQPNYHITVFFEKFISDRNEKTQMLLFI